MSNKRSVLCVLALYVLAAACSKSSAPATQIVVAISSDLMVGSQLSRAEVQVSKRDGSGPVSSLRFTLVGQDQTAEQGQQKLPVTFSVGKSKESSFLIVVTGYGPLGADGAEEKVVEQRAIVTFQDGKTLLLQIFLGSKCLKQFCDDAGLVCYVSEAGGVNAGECGPPIVLGSGDLETLDLAKLGKLQALVQPPSSDGSTGGDGAGGGARGGGIGGTGLDAGAAGSSSSDPCATANGGCDPLVTCSASGTTVTCGACPSGYADTKGSGTSCTDIDECKGSFDCKINSTCMNTQGGYGCPCDMGYHGDGHQECLANTLCNASGSNCGSLASCMDVSGTRYCVCSSGYEGDGASCTDIDECASKNGGCGDAAYYTCTNNVGRAPTCTAIEAGCHVNSMFYLAGRANPGNACQICLPSTSTSEWTTAPQGSSCGTGAVCNGISCVSGCSIGGAIYTPNQANPGNACQTCQPSATTTSWTTASGSACGNACVNEQTDSHNCGACGHTCSTAHATGNTCSSATCAPTCLSGYVDCFTPSSSAADDGCECAGNGCCGSACQTQHSNGTGQVFYDCSSVGTYTQASATAACAALTGTASGCTYCSGSGTYTGSFTEVYTSFGGTFYMWSITGITAMKVTSCPVGGTGSGCSYLCPSGSTVSADWN